MPLIIKYKFTLIGILVGALGGFAYYYFMGCSSGTCAITSRPLNSDLYGAFLGGVLLNMFETTKAKKK
jgi:hypothetical protein